MDKNDVKSVAKVGVVSVLILIALMPVAGLVGSLVAFLLQKGILNILSLVHLM